MLRSVDKKFLKKIALQIKQLRDTHGVTQEAFLNDTGIHIGRIEMAERDFSINTLKKICEYFDVSLEDFFKNIK